jgi:hypothetical protein
MDQASTFCRKLFVHPAHRTVGVLGCRSALETYRPIDDGSAADADVWHSEDDGAEPQEDVPSDEPA